MAGTARHSTRRRPGPPPHGYHALSFPSVRIARSDLPPFLIGLAALPAQAVLLRELLARGGGNELALTLDLSLWLLGSALGAFWWGRPSRSRGLPFDGLLAGGCIVSIAAVAIARLIPQPASIPGEIPSPACRCPLGRLRASSASVPHGRALSTRGRSQQEWRSVIRPRPRLRGRGARGRRGRTCLHDADPRARAVTRHPDPRFRRHPARGRAADFRPSGGRRLDLGGPGGRLGGSRSMALRRRMEHPASRPAADRARHDALAHPDPRGARRREVASQGRCPARGRERSLRGRSRRGPSARDRPARGERCS